MKMYWEQFSTVMNAPNLYGVTSVSGPHDGKATKATCMLADVGFGWRNESSLLLLRRHVKHGTREIYVEGIVLAELSWRYIQTWTMEQNEDLGWQCFMYDPLKGFINVRYTSLVSIEVLQNTNQGILRATGIQRRLCCGLVWRRIMLAWLYLRYEHFWNLHSFVF